MTKQTAVEWLIEQLTKQKEILKNHFEEGKWNDDRCSEIDNCLLLCEQAKQMEREQIEKAYAEAISDEYSEEQCLKYSKQYFTDTYGKEELLP